MHDCRKFRERVIEQVIGPSGASRAEELEFDACHECERFVEETLAINRAVSAVDGIGSTSFTPEESWNRFERRLQMQLANEPAPRRQPWAHWTGFASDLQAAFRRPRWQALGAIGVAALALVVWQLTKTSAPPVPEEMAQVTAPLPLDPQTVEFLGRSEMFLRDFSKIQPSDAADLEDARDRARMQLAAIAQRKAAAAAMTPVWNTLEEYETVLREIKNLDEHSGEDVADIQSRIARQGLIAAMKVYQPRDRRESREN
jgi:hypothetical protein